MVILWLKKWVLVLVLVTVVGRLSRVEVAVAVAVGPVGRV